VGLEKGISSVSKRNLERRRGHFTVTKPSWSRPQAEIHGVRFLPYSLSLSFYSSSLPSLPPLSLPRSGPSDLVKGSGGALSPPVGENDICSHQALNTPKMRLPQTHCICRPWNLSNGCKCCSIPVKLNLKIEVNVVVSECRLPCVTVYCMVSYVILHDSIRDYFLHFMSWMS